jgi:hypothetical protein
MQWSLFLPYYHVYGILFILFAVFIGVWLVFHVEKARQLSLLKLVLGIIVIALSSGIGLHLILIAAGF